MSECGATIRPMPNDTEIRCDEPHTGTDPNSRHSGELRDYAYPGSVTRVFWLEDDRRNFRGPWVACPEPGCILPGGHRGTFDNPPRHAS